MVEIATSRERSTVGRELRIPKGKNQYLPAQSSAGHCHDWVHDRPYGEILLVTVELFLNSIKELSIFSRPDHEFSLEVIAAPNPLRPAGSGHTIFPSPASVVFRMAFCLAFSTTNLEAWFMV